jgi:hypothetical protein
MRIVSRLLLGVLLSGPVALVAQHSADPTNAVAGGGTLPTGWHAHVDRNAALANVKFVTMGSGYHATLGPAVILWRAADTASGSYRIGATFTQTKAPRYPEGYGLFFGGRDLAGAAQRYTYFLVRSDGTFLVKRRSGDSTSFVTPDWTSNPAVVRADSATGAATNEVGVAVKGDSVRFVVNGKDVFVTKASNVDVTGLVGYRVNHNLDVHVTALEVHRF